MNPKSFSDVLVSNENFRAPSEHGFFFFQV